MSGDGRQQVKVIGEGGGQGRLRQLRQRRSSSTRSTSASISLPRWARHIPSKKNTNSTNVVKVQTKRGGSKQYYCSVNAKIEEEDLFLRTQCYHVMSNRMDRSVESTMSKLFSNSLFEINHFLSISAGRDINQHQQHGSRKRQRTSSSSDDGNNHGGEDGLRRACHLLTAAPHSCNPRLLPVLFMDGPSFGLDRFEVMKLIVTGLRRSRKRSAVVWLQHQNHKNSLSKPNWFQDVVKQCLRLEPFRHRSGSNRLRKILAASSPSDILLLWARYSLRFDDIIICLEVEDNFYGRELQDFLLLLAMRRSEFGLPLNVIMMTPHDGRRAVDLRSWAQGTYGFYTKKITLPSSATMLDSLWKGFITMPSPVSGGSVLPMLFPSSVRSQIRQSFSTSHGSSTRTILQLKQALAHSFSARGSFLPFARDEQFLQQEWARIAWFCLDPQARKFVLPNLAVVPNKVEVKLGSCSEGSVMVTTTGGPTMLRAIHEMEIRQKQIQLLQMLLHHIKTREKQEKDITSLCALSGSSCSRYLYSDDGDNPSLFHVPVMTKLSVGTTNSKKKDILSWLFKQRKSVVAVSCEDRKKSESKSKARRLLERYADCLLINSTTVTNQVATDEIVNFLNELIIVFGHCNDNELGKVQQGLVNMLDESVLNPTKYMKTDNDTSYDESWDSFLEMLLPEPRRMVVDGLMQVLPSDDPEDVFAGESVSLFNVAGEMYSMISNQISIRQSEWFTKLWDHIQNNNEFLYRCGYYYLEDDDDNEYYSKNKIISEKQAFALFSCGIRYLKIYGLIFEKAIGNRKEAVFEKTKLVWCS